jgi:Vam6/Vps39-like protein vacuolar protein sorting-associated protein 39
VAGTRLLIGTSKGQLLVYSVPHTHDASGRFKVDLQETKKGFSKKPIVQLTAVEQFNVLLSLTDNYVYVHDLKLFREQAKLEKTKGCTLYALDVQDRRDPTLDSHRSGENASKSAIELRMRLAVVVRKKIITFEWMHRDGEFRERKEFNLPDQPKVLSWAGDCLIVGMKREYLYINEEGDISEIWKNGLAPTQDPILSRLPGNEFLLSKEALSIFIGLNSKPTRQYALNFTEQPVCIDLVAPYAIALTSK